MKTKNLIKWHEVLFYCAIICTLATLMCGVSYKKSAEEEVLIIGCITGALAIISGVIFYRLDKKIPELND